MAEQIDLTTPIQTPNLTGYRVLKLSLFRGFTSQDSTIDITLIANVGGQLFNYTYSGPTAFNLIFALNTANLQTKSLERRILERLVADGILIGSVNGTPNQTPDPTPW